VRCAEVGVGEPEKVVDAVADIIERANGGVRERLVDVGRRAGGQNLVGLLVAYIRTDPDSRRSENPPVSPTVLGRFVIDAGG
jgi:hypothetical protein